MKNHYDLICIGGGSGGLAMAKRAASYGQSVLVVEGNKLGGTCVNVGCVPKKIIWHAAQLIDFNHLSSEYGFESSGNIKLDWSKFVDKRNAFIQKLNTIYEKGLVSAGVDVLEGYAEFIDNHSILVDGKTITADHITIAVGGKPIIPPIKGSEYGIDSNGFFALKNLPKSIAIVGSGYIAIELAGLLNVLGVKTHLIVRKNRFLKQVDDKVVALLDELMQADGVCIHYETEITEVIKNNTNLSLALTTNQQIDVDCLLWAIGRAPLFDNLGLDKTDINVLSNGNIEIDDYQNTSVAKVYAIGDITGQPTLTPAAIKAGRKLADRVFGNKPDSKADFTYVPTVIFSHPAIGTVGLTEEEAKAKYDNVRVYQSQFNPLLRSLTPHKVPTLVRVICQGDNETVVGIHIIGDFADEIIQGFSVAVQMGATKQDLDDTLAIHPTSAEELVTLT